MVFAIPCQKFGHHTYVKFVVQAKTLRYFFCALCGNNVVHWHTIDFFVLSQWCTCLACPRKVFLNNVRAKFPPVWPFICTAWCLSCSGPLPWHGDNLVRTCISIANEFRNCKVKPCLLWDIRTIVAVKHNYQVPTGSNITQSKGWLQSPPKKMKNYLPFTSHKSHHTHQNYNE